MWQELSGLSKDEIGEFRNLKRIKLYADEDIEDDAVDYLRDEGINITSARELGHRGKPDSFHAAYAFKQKRFLLTKNEKDYFNERDLPFNRTYGIIAIVGDMGNMAEYTRSLLWLFHLVPYEAYYINAKIRISPREMVIKFIDEKGQLVNKRFRQEKGKFLEWVD
jgi:hypothetical protein